MRETSDGPARERQSLEVETTNARSQNSEQVMARSLVESCAFAQREDGTNSAIWSDDLVGSGYRSSMEAMKEKLREVLECNTGARWRGSGLAEGSHIHKENHSVHT